MQRRFPFALPLARALVLFLGSTMSLVRGGEWMSHGIPNFREVEPGIWRGGQPTAEGWAYLKSLKITTVVKLNTTRHPAEESCGLNIVRVPIHFSQQLLTGPKASALQRALEAMRSRGKRVFVHCTHGEDRTGLLVALHRVHTGQKTREEAYAEMCQCGFHRVLFGLGRAWERAGRKLGVKPVG